MKTLLIMFVLSVMAFTSCNLNKKSETMEKNIAEPNQQNSYVLNPELLVIDYVEYKGYFPEEGFLPTADVAVQVAESIFRVC